MLAQVEEVRVDPLAGDPTLLASNPMSQVPTLIDDADVVWTDSPLICKRLDALGGPKFIPDGESRWAVLRREVIADGAMELGVKWRLEQIRPEGERSSSWMERWRAGVLRSLDAAEAQTPTTAPFDLAAIATVCALTWLDFRHKELDWAVQRPKLAALQAALEARQSFKETAPK